MRSITDFLLRLLGIFIAAMLIGCGGTKEAAVSEAPGWFPSPPRDTNYLYGVATATSRDLQVALDKAATDGRAEIGRQVELRVTELQRKLDEEVGLGADAQLLKQYTQATEFVVSTSVSGSRIKDQKYARDGDIWRAWTLVEYPLGAANQRLLEQIKLQEQMYTLFRATQTFKELEEKVKEFEEWKKQQPK